MIPLTPGRDNVPIDRLILPICERVNASGYMRTVESCEGHPERKGETYKAPFVAVVGEPGDVIAWVDRAEALRKLRTRSWPEDTLITALYVGGNEFRVQGQYVSPEENELVRLVLRETI